MGERKERKSRLKGDEYGTARFRKKGARLLSFERNELDLVVIEVDPVQGL
jgi:hypothetical protein